MGRSDGALQFFYGKAAASIFLDKTRSFSCKMKWKECKRFVSRRRLPVGRPIGAELLEKGCS
jgi:hypothetical protein